MKRVFFTFLIAFFFVGTSFAQGEVFFANRIPGSIDARAGILPGAGAFADSRFNADLAVLRNGVWESVPGSITPFRGTPGSAANGYITGFGISIPGIPPGAAATLRMRGFLGASFEAATFIGETHDVSVTLGGGTISVPNMDGLGFGSSAVWCICIPEPSTVALGFLGATVPFFVHRRNK